MTERAQFGNFVDYLHALAVRVLCEDRLLQPRRSGLFETEFAGPSEVGEEPVLTMEASPAPTTRSPALAPYDSPDASSSSGIPTRISLQSFTPSEPNPSSGIENDPLTAATAPRVDAGNPQHRPATTTRAPAPMQPAEIDVRVVNTEIQSPALLKPGLIPASDLRLPQPAPSPAPSHPVAHNPSASSRLAAHGHTEVSASESAMAGRRLPASSGPEPLPGAMVAHALPEMRSLAPLISPTPQPTKEAPTVEITIGRLELRAVAAKPPATPTRTAAPPTRQTLQEYLTRNTGGRR